jgi:hypothetical protein
VQSVPIVMSSNPFHGEVYLIHHYVINLSVTCGRSVSWFSPGTSVSSTNITDRKGIIEMLLNVALNSIKPNVYIDIYVLVCISDSILREAKQCVSYAHLYLDQQF